MNLRILVVLAGCAAALWAVRRWRLAVQLAMVLLVFEGAIRKWLAPGAQDLVYFAKDVLLLGVYVGFFRELPRLRARLPPASRPSTRSWRSAPCWACWRSSIRRCPICWWGSSASRPISSTCR